MNKLIFILHGYDLSLERKVDKEVGFSLPLIDGIRVGIIQKLDDEKYIFKRWSVHFCEDWESSSNLDAPSSERCIFIIQLLINTTTNTID